MMLFKPDYIVCGHLHFSPIALMAKLTLGIPYSLSLYGIEAISIVGLGYKKAVISADRVIVISEYTKRLVDRQFSLLPEKYFMLISSVDENAFNIIPNKEALKVKYGMGRGPIVLTLSRLSSGEEKGQHRVLAAFQDVLSVYPDAKYLVVGPGADHRMDAVLASHPSLRSNLIYFGPATDEQKLELYNLCDVFILPSKNEGFGIVFIEALGCGTPVIASDAYGCREALRGGRLGRLVDPDSSRAISDAIIDALTSTEYGSEEVRNLLRIESLCIYGYSAWCKKIKNFTERIEAL
jgi:glycosyltransferase involved in cell wall biosynthesis